MTEEYDPRYCFAFSSIMGVIIAFVASRIDVRIENEGLPASESNQ